MQKVIQLQLLPASAQIGSGADTDLCQKQGREDMELIHCTPTSVCQNLLQGIDTRKQIKFQTE